MKHMRFLPFTIHFSLFTIFLSGCGEATPPGMPQLFPVSITITMDGNPLEGALVSCVPEDGSQWFAGGITDAAGKVALQTKGRYNGIAVGTFKVAVIKNMLSPDSTESETKQLRIVDKRFNETSTSPLSLVVDKTTKSAELQVEPAPKNDFIVD